MKILICDDHSLVREGLRGVLAQLTGPVELLLLDLQVPGVDGVLRSTTV